MNEKFCANASIARISCGSREGDQLLLVGVARDQRALLPHSSKSSGLCLTAIHVYILVFVCWHARF